MTTPHPDALSAALTLADDHGLAVFTCKPGSKEPATPHGFKDATTDADTIMSMFAKTPDANLGIRTGIESGLVVLDVDVKNGAPGLQSLADLEARIGKLPPTVKATTPSGGHHFYFAYPNGVDVPSRMGKLAPGLDIKAKSGYILSAPSHLANGSYSWVPGHAPGQIELADLTPRLLDLLIKPSPTSPPKDAPTPRPAAPAGTALERCRRYVAKIDPAIDGQGGSNPTLEVACTCCRFGLDDTDAMTILREYSARCSPPWSDAELAHKLKDARAKVEAAGEFGSMLRDDRKAIALTTAGAVVADALNVVRTAKLVRLCDVPPSEIRWLWYQRIALGKFSLLAGDPGLGKSFLTLDIAARVSTGAAWPDRPGERFEPAGVVLFSAEDDLSDTVVNRLNAAGADLSRITAIQGVKNSDPATGAELESAFDLTVDLPALEDAILRTPDCRLVIIDPISAAVGRDTDSHSNTEIRAILAPLGELAARHHVAVIAVTHLRKGDGKAVYRAMGSLAFTAAARAVWGVERDEDDPERRLFLPIKNNLGNDRTGLAYSLRATGSAVPCVSWEAAAVLVSADDAMSGNRGDSSGKSERDEAIEWIKSVLASGAQPAKEMKRQADEAGLSWSTIKRAKRAAGAISDKGRDGAEAGWVWSLK